MRIREIKNKIFTKSDYFLGNGHRIRCIFSILHNYLKYGIHITDYFIYSFYSKNAFEKNKYITPKRSRTLENLNDIEYRKFFVDKALFNEIFKKYLNRDWIYLKNISVEEFNDFVNIHNKCILKNNWLCEGQGISKIEFNNEKETKKFYEQHIGSDCILEEIVQQHELLMSINPESVNTIRVTTLLYKDQVNIISASFRCGVGSSVTDNLHGGGLCSAIDIDTGITISKGFDKDGFSYIKHPISNKVLLGIKIPFWNETLNIVKEAAVRISECKWLGWDIAITSTGPVIIEGNTNQACDLIQIGQEGKFSKIKNLMKQKEK